MAMTRRVGRPLGFDTSNALDAAVDLFWELGYDATTTRDLERKLEISQSSLYNTFGSKRDLLLAAVDRYEERIRGELFSILTAEGGGIAAVDEFVAALGAWIATNEHRGCLVVNLMATASDDPHIARRAATYRATIRTALTAALEADPSSRTDEARARAELLLAAILGLHLTARSSQGSAEVAAMVSALRNQIASWAGA